MQVELTVNGSSYKAPVEPQRTLADFLRDDLRLTGTHLGCEHGVCGACTVIVDGQAVRSCLMFAVQADGSEVMTIEGLEKDGKLHPLQEAFRDCHSFQCGFCTPGFVMTALAMIEEGTAPATEEELREELSGNLCRCTGYQSIVEGVTEAIRRTTEPDRSAPSRAGRRETRRGERAPGRGPADTDRAWSLRRRHPAAAHAARHVPPQPVRPCPNHRARCDRGAAGARRHRRLYGRRHEGDLQADQAGHRDGPDAGVLPAGHRQGALRRRPGGHGGGRVTPAG